MIMFVMQDIPETTDCDSHFAVSWLFKIVVKINLFHTRISQIFQFPTELILFSTLDPCLEWRDFICVLILVIETVVSWPRFYFFRFEISYRFVLIL